MKSAFKVDADGANDAPSTTPVVDDVEDEADDALSRARIEVACCTILLEHSAELPLLLGRDCNGLWK